MYANTTTGMRPNVSKTKETKVIQMLYFFTTVVGVIIQDVTTTTEEWFGLNYDDADGLCVSSETSTLAGVTRNYLGSARLSYDVIGGGWCRSPSCWGTKIVTSMNRMGETNCYHVTRTTTTYEVRRSGQNTSLTLE